MRDVLDTRARGEHTPHLRDVFEMLVGPLYGYALLGRSGLSRAPALVERLLRNVTDPSDPGRPPVASVGE